MPQEIAPSPTALIARITPAIQAKKDRNGAISVDAVLFLWFFSHDRSAFARHDLTIAGFFGIMV